MASVAFEGLPARWFDGEDEGPGGPEGYAVGTEWAVGNLGDAALACGRILGDELLFEDGSMWVPCVDCVDFMTAAIHAERELGARALDGRVRRSGVGEMVTEICTLAGLGCPRYFELVREGR